MNGFKTSRALIVDDTLKEAMPVLKALGSIGIGSIYHDASPDADYRFKYDGLRLLVLDMVLANRGAIEGDPKAVVGVLIGALEQLLEHRPGVVVVVCWTKHPGIKDFFEEAFRNTFPEILLAGVLLFVKSEIFDLETGEISDGDKFNQMIQSIREALDSNQPAALLSHWEQLVHGATTRTTGIIYDAARVYANAQGKTWTEGAYAVCAALALAERGTRLIWEDPVFSAKALTDALGPLLLDRIEHFEASEVAIPEVVAATLLSFAKEEVAQGKESKSLLPRRLRAELNSAVNTALNVRVGEVSPGNVYLMHRDCQNRKASKHLIADTEWREAADDSFFDISGKLPAQVFPVMIEVSPPCDFAQAKSKVPRFLVGYLIAEGNQSNLRTNTQFLRTLGVFNMPEKIGVPSGDYLLVANSHYLMTLPRDLVAKLTPAFRLRSPVTADLVAWLAAHMSRPGYAELKQIEAI